MNEAAFELVTGPEGQAPPNVIVAASAVPVWQHPSKAPLRFQSLILSTSLDAAS